MCSHFFVLVNATNPPSLMINQITNIFSQAIKRMISCDPAWLEPLQLQPGKSKSHQYILMSSNQAVAHSCSVHLFRDLGKSRHSYSVQTEVRHSYSVPLNLTWHQQKNCTCSRGQGIPNYWKPWHLSNIHTRFKTRTGSFHISISSEPELHVCRELSNFGRCNITILLPPSGLKMKIILS